MRIITRIAKNELRHLFYSPIAWFLALIMLVMGAVFYTDLIFESAKTMALVTKYQPSFVYWQVHSITALIFNDLSQGYFATILQQLYLFVPLLTMGIISKEFNNGTIALLYASPVKLRQIVLGKYLALVVYCFLLISISGIFIALGFADIQALDLPPLLSGSLGLFLLLSALTAIGFFMSSLTNYQIVSAIATFTLLFVLFRIGGLWQDYDFLRDLTWLISISGRTEKMLLGLMSTKDILYYFVIIFMFLMFTFLKLQDGLETRSWYIRIFRYVSVILVGLAIGYMGSRPATTAYLDTTAQQLYTVQPKTQQLLGELKEGPLEVTLYTNLFSDFNYGLPRERNRYVLGFWEQYQRFKKDIRFNYVYYYAAGKGDSALLKKFPGKSLKQIAGIIARTAQIDSVLFKSQEEVADIASLEAENFEFLMKLNYQGRTTILRTYIGEGIIWPVEQNVNAALSRLLNKPIPKIYFVTGEFERSIYKKGEREIYFHTLDRNKHQALINTGFDLDTLNLSIQEIPASASTLVLADPRTELAEPVMIKLRNYISTGGNMLILGEPGKQHVLNPLLDETGIKLMDGQLVQLSQDETPEKVLNYLSRNAIELSDEPRFKMFEHVWNGGYPDSSWAMLAGVTKLSISEVNGFKVSPLLMTRPGQIWLKAGNLIIDSTAPSFDPNNGDSREVAMPVAVQLTRMVSGKEQRIVVTGDADVISNIRGQGEITRSFYSWCVYGRFPVYRSAIYAKDNIVIATPKRAAIQQIIFKWIVPSIVLLAAIVILIRRKRK